MQVLQLHQTGSQNHQQMDPDRCGQGKTYYTHHCTLVATVKSHQFKGKQKMPNKRTATQRHRITAHQAITVRGIESDGKATIGGLASVFDSVSYGEKIAPGAFTKTLMEQKDIKSYWGHDANKILARTTNGTLRLAQSEKGLEFEADLNLNTTWGRDAYEAIQSGLVDQMSFGFYPVKQASEIIDGESVVVVKEVHLTEVSPVTEPWYSETHVTADTNTQAEETEKPILDDHFDVDALAEEYSNELELLEMEI